MNDTIEQPVVEEEKALTVKQRIEKLIDTKPSDKIKIVNVFDNNYRVNVYSFELRGEMLFTKATLSASYFVIAHPDGTLEIEESTTAR